jgi:glycosyltransferase involved in cell wall biosynthesis
VKADVMFIFSKFPAYDEAFLQRELAAIAGRMSVGVFSLKQSREEIVHEEARGITGPVLSPPSLSADILRAQVVVLATRPRAYVRALLRIVLGNLRHPLRLAKTLACFPMAVYLARWVQRHGVRHVHAVWATYPASVAMVISDITGIPFSFAGHAHDLYFNPTQLREKVARAAFVTTCTASNRAFLRELAPEVPEDRVLLLHHGVSVERFACPPKTATGPLEILSVATLNAHKGLAHLLDALARLRELGIDFRATIAGGGPLEAALDRQRRELGLEAHVTMTGALEQSAVVDLYRRASVFVLMAQPEWHWGIPNVIIEALAARAAVITTRFGSVEELIQDGQTGLLVGPRDAEGLAAALARLAADPAERTRLAEAGHRVVAREFDLQTTAEAYVQRFHASTARAAPVHGGGPAPITKAARPIRVLYVIDKLHRAGTQVHLARLLQGLDRRAVDPHVCCLVSGGPLADTLREAGIPVETLGLRNIYGPRAWRGLGRLSSLCRERGIDILHAYLISSHVYGTVAAQMARVPVVITSRRDTGFSRNWRLRVFEEWLINPMVDRVTAAGPAVAAAARRERGLHNGKVVVIPNGLDLAEWDERCYSREAVRREWKLGEGDTAIGVIGHLSAVKGHADLIEAAAALARDRGGVRLFVVGDGPLRASLESQVAALGLTGRVVFTGVRADVARLLAMLDVVVVPSHTEGMSNALLEAMAMARPVIATAVDGNLDVVRDGVTGLLVPPRDPAALAAALLRLVDAPERAREMGRAARTRIEEAFTVQAMITRHEELYRGLAVV